MLLLWWQLGNAMLPVHVDVAAEGVERAVGERGGHRRPRAGVLECHISAGSEAGGNRAVLDLCKLRLYGSRVMVKRFPLRAIPVPVEARGLDVHPEVLLHAAHDPLERRALLLPPPCLVAVVCDHVRVAVPGNKQRVGAGCLDLRKEVIVQGLIFLRAKDFRSHHHIPHFKRLGICQHIFAKKDPHICRPMVRIKASCIFLLEAVVIFVFRWLGIPPTEPFKITQTWTLIHREVLKALGEISCS
mmetsp:Transcript_19263/g.32063  ORF Transcript_19263/g.32063 Transcript_19263/m.32063 type:complete len:244 (+) Transcript_19263:410-1141(+)